MTDFPKFPKIPRLNKLTMTVTEKLDGTNGLISLRPAENRLAALADPSVIAVTYDDNGVAYAVRAGSRERWLTPGKQTDNYGFAAFVQTNASAIVRLLGEGDHYGEWWGQGIQRNYGLGRKFFTLFNPARYPHLPPASQQVEERALLGRVEVLGTAFEKVDFAALELRAAALLLNGSVTVPGWMKPEGVVVNIGGQLHKVIVNGGLDKAVG